MNFQISAAWAWPVLLAAGALEMVWTWAMKASAGFTRPWHTALTLLVAWLSFALLALAMRHLPMGTAYAVWTGLGAAGTALVGMALMGEAATPARLACIGLVLAGIVGLKLLEA